jgi:hypothetical protein
MVTQYADKALHALYAVLILPIGDLPTVSLSSAFVVFMKNVYSKQFLEACILYFFNIGRYDWIANIRRHYFTVILILGMRIGPSFVDGYFSMVTYLVDCDCFWLFKSIRINLYLEYN